MKYTIYSYTITNGKKYSIYIGEVDDIKKVFPFIKNYDDTHPSENGLIRYNDVYCGGKKIDDTEWLKY